MIRREIMATKNNKGANSSGFVDISSNTQVVKLYKKKGRAVRIVAVLLAVILIRAFCF